MAITQGFAISRKRRYGDQASGIATRAQFLPQIYAQRESDRRYRSERAEQKRQFNVSMEQQQQQFDANQALQEKGLKEQRRQTGRAENIARAGMGLQVGMLGLSAYRAFGGTEGVKSTPASYRRQSAEPPGTASHSRAGTIGRGLWSERVAWGAGGVGGGMMGAGIARFAGAKKKWQVGLAGAAGGAMGTYMAGGSGWSMGLGALIGGGLGALLG